MKINQIVNTVSVTHKFDKDKLYAINTSDVENGVLGEGILTPVEDLKGQFKKTIQKTIFYLVKLDQQIGGLQWFYVMIVEIL